MESFRAKVEASLGRGFLGCIRGFGGCFHLDPAAGVPKYYGYVDGEGIDGWRVLQVSIAS